MPDRPTRGPSGIKDSSLNAPYHFRCLIEGGVEGPDPETVRAMVLANISFTAGFGQMISQIRVGVGDQKTGLFDKNGVRVM